MLAPEVPMLRLPVALLFLLGLACAGAGSEGRTAGDCSDDADNDGDGLFDCDDDGCDGSGACATPEVGTTDDSCDGISSTGTGTGDIPPQLTGNDQDSVPFRLYDHCDDVVVIIDSATWEGASIAAAAQAQDLWDAHRDDGLTVVMALGENDDSQPPEQADLAAFADDHDLTYPVIADPEFAWAEGLDAWNNALPFIVYLEPGLTIGAVEGEIDAGWVEDHLP
jgi:hypothetical protein